MQKNKNIIFKQTYWRLFLIILASLVFLTACSGQQASSGQPSTTTNDSTNNTSNSTNEQQPAENNDEPIKIGVILSFTGPFAPLAENIKNGLELFFDERNYMIGNHKVELKYEDDEGNPQVALRKYNQLKESEKVDMVVGPISSAVLYALRDQVDKDEMLLIVANAAGNDIAWDRKSDYIYRVFMSNWQSGHAGAAYFADHVGKKALVIAPDYAAGHETVSAFEAAFTEAGGQIVEKMWNDLGTNDFAAYLTSIAQTKPDFVFSVQTGTDAVRFLQQYKQFGLLDTIPLTSWHEFGNELNTKPAGDASLGVLSALNYATTLDNEVNQKFVAAYKEKYNQTPSVFSVNGYDSGLVIASAVEQAGSIETKELIKVLKGISIDSPRGKIVLDEKTNNPIQDFYIGKNIMENGEIVQEILHTVEKVAMPESKPDN